MPLQPKFNRFSTTSPVVASFSFTELVSGEGIIELQAMASTDSSGISYNLTSSPIKSDPTESLVQVNNTTITTTYNFDSSPLNIARTLRGTAQVSVLFANKSSGSDQARSRLIISIQHYDGSTATTLATKTTVDIVNTLSSYVEEKTILLFDIPETNFSVGDIIRLKIDHFTQSSAISNKQFFFSHDPLNGTAPSGSTSTTQLKLNIPTKIDI